MDAFGFTLIRAAVFTCLLVAAGCWKRTGILFPDAGSPVATCPASGATTYHSLGSGTADDPYVLCTAAQLVDLMQPANAAAWKYLYALGADIDLAGYNEASTPSVSPIGTAAVPFSGELEGGGHTIANLSYTNASADYVGLFGLVSGSRAVIQNLRLTAVTITGAHYAGGLVGWLDHGATIMTCSTSGTVTVVFRYGGGLAGVVGGDWTNLGDGSAVVSTSSSSATVNGGDSTAAWLGGLVGGLGSASFCVNSYATGSVSTTGNFAGGLVGGLNWGGAAVNSYAAGDVAGAQNVGGLAGSSGGQIISSFTTGNVAGHDASTTGALVGESWGSLTAASSFAGASCTVPSASCHGALAGESPDATLEHFFTPGAAPLSGFDFTHVWTAGPSLPELHPQTSDLRAFGSCAAHQSDAPYAGGWGTLEAPFLICIPAQLAAVGMDTAGLSAWHAYRLMDSLDLSSLPCTGIPIGNQQTPFFGAFDGNGQLLSHLTCVGLDQPGGLFGALSGRVQRLGLDGASVSGTADDVGLIAGRLLGGGIADCYARGTASSTGFNAGGLVGEIDAYGAVAGSYFAGSINAKSGGGITGDAVNSHLLNCFASADVSLSSGGGGPLSSSTIDASNFFDSSRACSGCNNTNGTAVTPTGYFYDPANPPLSTWDFDRVWRSNAPNGFPTFR